MGVCWEDTGHSAILEISVFCGFVFYSIPNFALDKNMVLEYFGDDTGHSRILEISFFWSLVAFLAWRYP